MTIKTKAAGLRTRAASKTDFKRNHKSLRSRIKALIVGAACWGILPVKLAEWIIRRGGLRDA